VKATCCSLRGLFFLALKQSHFKPVGSMVEAIPQGIKIDGFWPCMKNKMYSNESKVSSYGTPGFLSSRGYRGRGAPRLKVNYCSRCTRFIRDEGYIRRSSYQLRKIEYGRRESLCRGCRSGHHRKHYLWAG